jgi:hypothetical protein
LLLTFALAAPMVRAQGISFEDPSAAAKKPHVVLASDTLVVEAGKAQDVELLFRVDEGYHINSHTPKDELLIPTALTLNAGPGVKVISETYPKGAAFKLEVGDGEVLDVYQGEFRVRLRVVAARGDSTLMGSLRYQACDHAACFPPKTLVVRVAVQGK